MAGSEAASVDKVSPREVQDVSSEGVESVNDSPPVPDELEECMPVMKRKADSMDGDEIQSGSRKVVQKQGKAASTFVKCELCPRPAHVTERRQTSSLRGWQFSDFFPGHDIKQVFLKSLVCIHARHKTRSSSECTKESGLAGVWCLGLGRGKSCDYSP